MTKPVIDTSVLAQQLGGDNEFLSEIIKDYQKQREQLSVRMRESVESGALDDLHQHAHKLKGSLLTLGAKAAADAALLVETLSYQNKADEVAQALVALEKALDTLAPALENLVQHGFERR